ncbi:MAG: hypothetical protein GY869_14875 [Planctomycetes bacterium]|nr:hypothetical protein [Planctomycetota bacterium]
MENYLTLILCCLAFGALGLFLMLPRFLRVSFPKAGGILALAALAGLFGTLLTGSQSSRTGEHVWFVIFGAIAIACAVLMICQKRALYAALYFIMTAAAVAGLILLQQGEFLALALIIVYSGGILVLYIFALMLSRQQDLTECDTDTRTPFLAILIGFFMLGSILRLLFNTADNGSQPAAETDLSALVGTAQALGQELFTNHVVALEVAGIILLVAAVSAIAIIKAPKAKDSEEQYVP